MLDPLVIKKKKKQFCKGILSGLNRISPLLSAILPPFYALHCLPGEDLSRFESCQSPSEEQ